MKTCGQWPACRLITFRKRDNVCVILLKAYYVLSAHRAGFECISLQITCLYLESLCTAWYISRSEKCVTYVLHKGYINVLAFRWMQEISICSLQLYWQQGSRAFQSNRMAITKDWLTLVPIMDFVRSYSRVRNLLRGTLIDSRGFFQGLCPY